MKSLSEWLARKPKGKAPKKPLPKYTPKRAKQLGFYRILRKGFLEANTHCQAKFLCCSGSATQVHHKNSRVGDKLNDTRDFLAICAPCHLHLHAHPKQARLLGLLT